MISAIRVTADTIRSVLFSSITNSYLALGLVFANQVRMMRIVNATDGDIFISLDGVNNHFFVPAGSFVLYDFTANKTTSSSTFVLPVGTQLYIKYSSAPSKLSVYAECIYAVGE